jgi:hypothetical protein
MKLEHRLLERGSKFRGSLEGFDSLLNRPPRNTKNFELFSKCLKIVDS